jgi:hypothetical protein
MRLLLRHSRNTSRDVYRDAAARASAILFVASRSTVAWWPSNCCKQTPYCLQHARHNIIFVFLPRFLECIFSYRFPHRIYSICIILHQHHSHMHGPCKLLELIILKIVGDLCHSWSSPYIFLERPIINSSLTSPFVGLNKYPQRFNFKQCLRFSRRKECSLRWFGLWHLALW